MSSLWRMSRRTGLAWALVAAIVLAIVAPAAIAVAQDDDSGLELRGTVRAGRDIVADVPITVALADGETVGETASDAEGRWSIPVPGPGTYLVSIDTAAFPEGIALQAGAPAEQSIEVTDRSQQVVFRLQTGASSAVVTQQNDFERILNRFVSGIKVGLLVAMAAVGLSLIFGVTGLVNFAHSELVAFGAVTAFALEAWTPLPFLLVVVLAVMIGGMLGFTLEAGLFGPLRRRKMNTISLMVVSIGLAFVLRYLILIYFGSRQKTYEAFRIQTNFDIGPISLPPKDYWIMLTAVVVLVGVGLMLQKTKLGTAMRAVADNPPLARSSGIDVDRTILSVWIMGAALAALGGILLGLTQTVEWQMGERILLLIFAAVTLGGLGTAYGAMVGGLAIGIASELSVEWLDNDLKFLVALVALILILLVRPQGILGVRERFG
jgi:neutral amino acid transport system permease protein